MNDMHKDLQQLYGLFFVAWITLSVVGIAITYLLEKILNELRKKK